MPPLARHNVSTACTQCRSSKLKCDGKLPKCKRCNLKGRDCIYPSDDDKRRIPVKKALEVFVRRAKQLESFVAGHGLVAPTVRPDDREIFDKVMGGRDTFPLPASCVLDQTHGESGHGYPAAGQLTEFPTPPDPVTITEYGSQLISGGDPTGHSAQDQDPVQLQQKELIGNSFPDLPFLGDISDLQFNSLGPGCDYAGDVPIVTTTTEQGYPMFHHSFYNVHSASGNGQTHSDDLRGSEDDELSEDEDLISQLSNRMGHLHLMEDGQWRFYGATSNLNLAKHRFSNDTYANIPSTSQATWQPAVLREPLDPQLELLLENLYFSWQNPCYHVVDREMYEEGKRAWKASQQPSTFYSSLLTNAICAFGALFHQPRKRATQLAQACASNARILLDIELDAPKVATAQALVILSSLEAAATKDARGWLYCGMAMRLSFDLGLHVDMGPYVSQGQMTASEARARCTAFWGCYVVDHLWGFYLGRPFHTNSGNITVRKPSANLYSHQASASTDAALGSPPADGWASPSLGDEADLISPQWVSLTESMDALGNVMYGCTAASTEDLFQVARKTMDDLIQWKLNLPSNLAVEIDDLSTCPSAHLIVMHMQYYQIMIFIHRPFISEELSVPVPSQGNDPQMSRSACLEAAFAISKLIRLYEKNYTLQCINIQAVSIIFSAALFLVFASISPTQSHDREALSTHLDVCSQALAKLGEYYENASRSLDLLLTIKRDWKARLIAGNSRYPKRRRTSRFSTGQAPTKYLKTNPQQPITEAGDNVHGSETTSSRNNIPYDFDPFDSADWQYALDGYGKTPSN